MSPSITIPSSSHSTRSHGSSSSSSPSSPSSSKARREGSSYSSSYSTTSSSPSSTSSTPSSSPNSKQTMLHARRPSLLGSAICKQESTVINIGDPEGPPRLISYLASSQGFDWNPEIFLPSYVDHDYVPLEHRPREPVHEITLTEEETRELLPQ